MRKFELQLGAEDEDSLKLFLKVSGDTLTPAIIGTLDYNYLNLNAPGFDYFPNSVSSALQSQGQTQIISAFMLLRQDYRGQKLGVTFAKMGERTRLFYRPRQISRLTTDTAVFDSSETRTLWTSRKLPLILNGLASEGIKTKLLYQTTNENLPVFLWQAFPSPNQYREKFVNSWLEP